MASETTVTLKGIISYPNIFTPKAQDNGDSKYGATLLIPMSDTEQIDKIKAAIVAAYESGVASSKIKFSTPKNGITFPNIVKALGGKVTFFDGVEKQSKYHMTDPETLDNPLLAEYAELRTSATVKNPPKVFSKYGQSLTAANGSVFAGEIVHVVVNFYAYSVTTGKGISAGLNGVILSGEEGDLGRLGGSVDVSGALSQFFVTPTDTDNTLPDFAANEFSL